MSSSSFSSSSSTTLSPLTTARMLASESLDVWTAEERPAIEQTLREFESEETIVKYLQAHAAAYKIDVKALHAYAREYADQECVVRYLRAFKNQVSTVVKSILDTCVWRIEKRIDSLSARDMEFLMQQRLTYLTTGFDRTGRPIVITRKNVEPVPESEYERNLLQVIYAMERAIRLMNQRRKLAEVPETAATLQPPQVSKDGKWIWIMDLANYSRANGTPLSVTKQMIHVLSSHYTERLAIAIILDAPFVFRMLWNVVHVFLEKVTRDKIHFLQDRKSPATRAALQQWIDIDQLEEDFDGKQVYDWRQYMESEKELGFGEGRSTVAEAEAGAASAASILSPPSGEEAAADAAEAAAEATAVESSSAEA